MKIICHYDAQYLPDPWASDLPASDTVTVFLKGTVWLSFSHVVMIPLRCIEAIKSEVSFNKLWDDDIIRFTHFSEKYRLSLYMGLFRVRLLPFGYGMKIMALFKHGNDFSGRNYEMIHVPEEETSRNSDAVLLRLINVYHSMSFQISPRDD